MSSKRIPIGCLSSFIFLDIYINNIIFMDKNKELKEGLLDGFVHFINEATGSSGAGSFKMPLIVGLRRWEKDKLAPFTDKLTPFTSPELDYDILDGKLDVSPDTAREMEKIARQKSNAAKKINPNMYVSDSLEKRVKNILREELKKKKFDEATSVAAGSYNGPVEIGMKKWNDEELGPFVDFVDSEINHQKIKKGLKNNIKRVVGVWEKDDEDGYDRRTHDVHTISEDLAVWFGTKKKPKGSKQPKGPWVNICRKKEGGGHPPCGRPDADSKGYPKCRAVHVASKMTDAQKKAACAQKRRAEKKEPKSGTGNKPTMTSYKPKKK